MIQKKKKKRDRKEGLLDLLEKGKTKNKGSSNMEGLRRSCSFFFLIFFLSIIVVFFIKKNQSRD